MSLEFRFVAVFKFRNMKSGQATPVPEGEFTVGRSAAAQIRVDDSSVSRQHARLVNNAEGLFLEDLGSGNGTALQGAYLSGRAKIKPGDLVHIGSVPFRIDPEIGGEPVVPDPAAKPMDGADVKKQTNRIPIGTPMASGPLAPITPVTPVGKKEKDTGSLIRKSVPLPTLVKLMETPEMKTASGDLPPAPAPAMPDPNEVVRAPAAEAESTGFTPDAVSWQWWLIVFMAGMAAGLVIGLYFAKLFLDMGGKPSGLP